MNPLTSTLGVNADLTPVLVVTEVSFWAGANEYSDDPWQDEDFSLEEKERLVTKLDALRHEPTVSFESTDDAIRFLRSRISRAE